MDAKRIETIQQEAMEYALKCAKEATDRGETFFQWQVDKAYCGYLKEAEKKFHCRIIS